MTTVAEANLPKDRVYYESSPNRKDTIHFFARMLGGATLVAVVGSIASYCTGITASHLWLFPLSFLVMTVVTDLFLFFFLMPTSLFVDRERIVLREGRAPFGRQRIIPLDTICGLQLVRFQPKIHGVMRQKKYAWDRWVLGGDRVLEIILQGSDRVVIVSPRADQFAAALHETTHLPLADYCEQDPSKGQP